MEGITKTNNYYRGSYGELYAAQEYEIWRAAKEVILAATKKRKNPLPAAYDNIGFDRKGRADGDATHHEIYDIHPDPLRVLVCVREAEGSKYGVRTVSKTYYILKKHGTGVRVTEAKKSIAAKASKNAGCELGCAINVVEGKTKLQLNRACSNGVAYKQLSIRADGRLYSVYDGSLWTLNTERYDRALQNHNGGLYVFETCCQAQRASFPSNSINRALDKVVVKCHVSGNYCRYGEKLAFSYVTPINIEKIL